jgi:TorA maturation chaperone TorD
MVKEFNREAKRAEVRAGLYRLLALTLLKPPDREIMDLWADPELRDELEFLFSGRCLRELSLGLEAPETSPRAIRLAYDALFCVPIKGRSVSPYESVYREDHFVEGKSIKLLMGQSAAAVSEFYKSTGMEPPLAARELPDHIGMELLFLSGLCAAEAASRKNNDNDAASAWRSLQYRFLHEHLGQWVNPVAEDIRRLAGHDFIKAVAAMTAELVNHDLEGLAGRVSDASPNKEEGLEQRPGAN